MSFVTPLFFFGMLAAGIPVFLHLIKRERATKVEFPTLMFLRKISKKVIRFQKLRHLLLLLLRVLAFLLLALAFTRPFRETVSEARTAGKVTTAHIILLDNSMSMAYGDRWEKARKAAADIARSAGAGDKTALLTFSDQATALTQVSEDAGTVQAQITNGAELTDRPTRYGQALKLAEKVALEATAGKRIIHIISDFQKNGWLAEDQDFKFHSSIEVKPVDLGAEEYSNLTLGDVQVLDGDESSGGGLRIKSSVVNFGSQDRKNVAVNLLVDGRGVQEKMVDVARSAIQGVEFQLTGLSPGQHSVVIQVEDPQLTRDNRFNLTLESRAKTPVLSVENPGAGRGNRSPSFFLAHALNILSLSPYRLTTLTPQKAESLPSLSGGLLVWNNTSGGSAALQKKIQSYVREGGGLVIVVAEPALASDFNRTFASWIPVKMDDSGSGTRGSGAARSGTDYALLTDIKLDHPIFRPFSEPHSGSFASAKIFKHTRLVPGAGAEVLARYDNGDPALAAAPVDKGRVLIFTSSADDSANDLPLKAVFAPFWQQMLRYIDNLQEGRRWVEVGETFSPQSILLESMLRQGKTSIDLNQAIVVVDAAKQRVPVAARSDAVAVDQTGFYEIRTAALTTVVAVNPVPRESDLTHANAEELVAGWISSDAGAPAVIAEDERLSVEEQERQQRIWRYLLLAVLVFLISECLLANQSVLKPD